MPSRLRRTGNTPLKNRLALYRFICREFGYDDMQLMLERLGSAPAGFDANGESEYARALYLNPALSTVTPDQFSAYDANIVAHSRRLRMTGEHGREWKPYQYLALLFTEHYLNRYFTDLEALCASLNVAKSQDRLTATMPDYEPDELRTLAFQSATGSGKTLLMHAHILQFQHYLARSGGRLNNIVLLTPNEQMSAQHERELQASGLRARLFSAEAGAGLFSHIEIIDLNKLAEKKGVKRVAVQDFGDNNLVLVDEGHLGASGKVWRERRKELSRGGFTFEYSATFNQVVGKDTELLNAYAKCLLFDYAYRQFHDDGYGKDYAISNLPSGIEDASGNMYLLGCLLTFYQQCRIWRDKGAQWTDFNLTRPLWVFLGKTVTGSSRADTETKSDVLLILDFLGWVLANADAARPMLDRLLAGQSGLPDETGNDYFAGRFGYLNRHSPDDLYADMCDTLFHGQGKLHVVYLTAGEGELHLRSADNPVFGVVNIGDSTALHKLLVEKDNPAISTDREAGFAERLFANVDRPDSTVNIVIGARRFIAGWNSWRVSTMGLMHVGVGEGPEIIQMFGRGVRLKGWNTSLKRHRKSGVELPSDSVDLGELETLYIFGLRANYMQTFRNLLEKEGMRVEQETVALPVTWNFGKKPDLKLIRLKGNQKYERSEARVTLPNPGDADAPVITLDLYSQLQSVASGEGTSVSSTRQTAVTLAPCHTSFFNRARLYDTLLRRKRQRDWHNLAIRPETVESLLQNETWYDLYMPRERLNVTDFQSVRELEDIALDLMTEYADQFWRKQRRRWESDNIEVVTLDESDPNNVKAYELSVDVTHSQLIGDIQNLKANIEQRYFDSLKLGAIMTGAHAYQPLLYARKDCNVTVRPVALNENEKKVVEGLVELAESRDQPLRLRSGQGLQDTELYLIRNLTRGRGVSFFDDFGYYPDFIVWLNSPDCQHVIFLDPKGLSRLGARERKKVALYRNIKTIEERIREIEPKLRLHAYVLSVTPPGKIDDGRRSSSDWKNDGVYFLNTPDCLQQVIEDVLNSGQPQGAAPTSISPPFGSAPRRSG